MMKIDCSANQYVADKLKEYDWVINATADCEENYWIDDVMFSAGTEENYIGIPMEVKTLKGGWQFKYDDEWNPYFTCDIYNKLTWKSTVPEVGTPIYFVNATDAYGNFKKGKFGKLLDNHACLSFLAPDGILIYDHRALTEAFCGYADYLVRHTTEFGNNKRRLWETKAILDLSKATYVPCNPPIEIFEK